MIGGFQFGNLLQALRERNFRIFTIGSSLSLIGTWMQRIATGWLTWELTESTTWLGIMAFADLFPTVVIAMFAGAAADRLDQLRMMRLAQALGAFFVGLMSILYFVGALSLLILLAFTLVLGVIDACVQPFRLSLVSLLVPRGKLNAAVAIKSVTYNLARFVGPAMGGLMIATAGTGWVFVSNSASFIVFYWALSRIRLDNKPERDTTSRPKVFREILAGVRYIISAQGIRVVLFVFLASCIFGRPILELLPAWAAAFSGGTADFAALTSAFGIGAVCGGIWLAGRADPVGLTRVYLCCCIGLCVSLLAFAMSTRMLFALPLLAVAGIFMIASGICAQTLVQINVDERFRGRVLGVYSLILRGGPAIGALATGWVSEWFGMRVPLVIGALALLLIVLPALLKLRSLESALESRFGAGP